ncbi:hypothetical protein ABUW04_12475 [Streptacidiphilus sp. N1-10]|uniref:Uncharacterized protein n=1 Tax=Streptacidiphilus jeojiensis TaxID=3229225 RepID=A0ABV6XMB2_9ACTN
MAAVTPIDDPALPLQMLVGREISAVCFVRDYVEMHFDGPVLRALADPFGMFGCQGWRFPEGSSPTIMRRYIGLTVDECLLVPDRLLTVDSGEHRFAIPLDEASRPGPEAAHLIGVDANGDADPRMIWIW